MGTFIASYLAIGFVAVLALFGWVTVASIRRHGVRSAFRGAAKTYVEELPLYWRVPVVAWLFAVGLPLVVVWAIAKGAWDPVGAVFVGLLWLLSLAMLAWHYRAKSRVRTSARRRSAGRHS